MPSRCHSRFAKGLSVLAAVTLSLHEHTAHPATPANPILTLSRAGYADRVQAVWTAQILAVLLAWPHEHQTASVQWISQLPRRYEHAPVDDDWYYEMVAIRAFERFGIDMTVKDLGRQWVENACGSWGSSEQARLNLLKGVAPPETGHPRYNKLWFTIGPQFSADVYGALAPGMPNLAGRLAREFGHLNGYAEGVDGAVFMAGMVSLAFTETDPREIVRKAARLIHPESPYRRCLDEVIALASQGRGFEEIVSHVEDRWHIEYPATNNAVANGGLVAASVWFGEGDFLKTVNLAARAADFSDADCNAANAAAVAGALRGMDALPADLVRQLNDRIRGDRMGPLTLTPAVDEKISDLSRRTVEIGIQFLLANGASPVPEGFRFPLETPITQAPETFSLQELTRYWNPDWALERPGFGGAGGGMSGIRGITCLEGEVLATYPRDEVRGVVLKRTVTPANDWRLTGQIGADAGRAWELNLYVNNQLMEKRLVEGSASGGRTWHELEVDLSAFTGQAVELRLYQRVLLNNRIAGNAYWKALSVGPR